MLTADVLRQILHYEPATGFWTWLPREGASPQFKGKYEGKRAGSIDPDTGYWRIRIGRKLYYAHRLAVLYVVGRWPLDEVDHEDLDRANCKWVNLREATHYQNNTNKKNRSDNTSGFKGVSLDAKSGKWVSDFRINGARFRKYGFLTPESAGDEYARLVALHAEGFGRVA